MRVILSAVVTFGVLGLLSFGASGETASAGKTTSKSGAPAHKKTTTHRKQTRKTGATVHRKTGATTSRSHATRAHTTRAGSSRARKYARRTTWRNRQLTPTPARYKQIQEALAAKGYLPTDQANGQWNDASSAALKKFQADQNIDPSGKIDSLSLIALGLGPKHDAVPAQKAEPAAAPLSKPE